MARIPDEILAMDILSRLPVETISRFRCVSKDWRNLFDTPCFIKQYLKRSNENNNHDLMIGAQAGSTGRTSTLFSVQDINSLISNEYSPLKSHELDPMSTVHLWGSCNGLVCVLVRGSSLFDDALCIYNPSTRAYKKLPTPIMCGENIANYVSLSGYGFGYDSKVEDYKLVVMINGRGTSRVAVYTLGTNTWKDLENFTPILPLNEGHGVLANETIHWLVCPWRADGVTNKWVILSFDLNNETFQQSPPPKPVDHAHPCMVRMCSFEGSFCLIVNQDNVYLDIWVKKGYGLSDSSWTKLFTVSCQPRVDRLLSFVKPLKSFKNGEILMLLNNHALVLYDPETEILRTLKVGGGISKIWRAEVYPRSVVSVTSGSKLGTGNANSYAKTTWEALTRKQDAGAIRNEERNTCA